MGQGVETVEVRSFAFAEALYYCSEAVFLIGAVFKSRIHADSNRPALLSRTYCIAGNASIPSLKSTGEHTSTSTPFTPSPLDAAFSAAVLSVSRLNAPDKWDLRSDALKTTI